VPSSQALPGFLITAPPSVIVPAVLGMQAVWIPNQKKNAVCVLLCFVKPTLGNRYGPGVSSCQQTSDNNLGVSGSSPFTLTRSLAIPIPSSSSSNGPSN